LGFATASFIGGRPMLPRNIHLNWASLSNFDDWQSVLAYGC
jgi:hypothetical protein